ncbi:MAG: 2OG-Fe(II) oxygenase [Pseudomonadota bacterium]
MKINRLGGGAFTIEDFLSGDECSELIRHSESLGYSEAAIQTEDGQRLVKDARNNDRVIFDDEPLAQKLYHRAQALLPAELDGWAPSGFNQRFRFYRYEKQQQFTWHQDGTVRLGEDEESFLTFMVYLNEGFDGGSTDFGWESIQPVTGMALVFPHRLRHRGAVVNGGVKYILRTDVLYASKVPKAPGAPMLGGERE